MSLRAIALLGWMLTQGVAVHVLAAPADVAAHPVRTTPRVRPARDSRSKPSQHDSEAATVSRPAPFVAKSGQRHGSHERGHSARQGWLLRSNPALGLGSVSGVPSASGEYGQLNSLRFATTNFVSIGYGWRPNWALTLDGFRVVIPHYPHRGQNPEFTMRVDTEALALGLGSTVFIAPWSMHVGSTVGFAMSRIGGDSLTAPTHRGIGALSFAGFELMRSQGIGVVLAVQVFGIVARHRDELLTTRTYAISLGVTYW